MSIYFCKTCVVSCSSHYSYQQHLSGKKHRAKLSQKPSGSSSSLRIGGGGGGVGTCFYYKEGRCWKGSACTYRHDDTPSKTTSTHTGTSATCDISLVAAPASMITGSTMFDSSTIPGVCFYYQKGTCYKGAACSYKHIGASNDASATAGATSSNLPASSASNGSTDKLKDELVTELLLCKSSTTSSPAASVETTKETAAGTSTGGTSRLAPIFCKSVGSTSSGLTKIQKSKTYDFPAEYRNAFRGKRNVNLYIQSGLVVWEFAFDRNIMKAIKEHIKGRAWNPNIGIKGCWTCPLESLPEACALYEHMGRTPSTDLKKRAQEIEKAYGGASASDAIKIVFRFSLHQLSQACSPELSFGSATLTFFYDADVVAALKMLPPSQRNYDPVSKAWTVDILAIPTALEHLETVGYLPNKELKNIAGSIEDLEETMYGNCDSSNTANKSPPSPSQLLVQVKDEKEPSSPPIPELTETFSADSTATYNGEPRTPESSDERAADTNTTATTNGGSGIAGSDDLPENAKDLEANLKRVIASLAKVSSKVGALDRSDCGEAKRQRLTSSQEQWAMRQMLSHDEFDDSDDYLDYYGYSSFFQRDRFAMFATHVDSRIKKTSESKPVDCDCGRPWKRFGGVHTCRYFGTFRCNCGNRWTSAYCWKGERQACRSCNRESLPIEKEQLQGKEGKNALGGHHDTARCEMCRKLGYDCSRSSL